MYDWSCQVKHSVLKSGVLVKKYLYVVLWNTQLTKWEIWHITISLEKGEEMRVFIRELLLCIYSK